MADNLRLLLIEDDEEDAELVCLELERGGFQVEWERVETEESLRSSLQKDPWDLIISDFRMPCFDGMRAFEIARQLAKDIPFIFVSGVIGEERAVEAMRAGARDYLLKGSLARLCVAARRELASAATRSAELEFQRSAQREQRRFGMAVEASGAGIFEYKINEEKPPYLNPRALEILGDPPRGQASADLVRGWLAQRIHPDDVLIVGQSYDHFLAGRSLRLSVEFRLNRSGGKWIDVAVFAKAISREDGRVSHIVGVLMDLTERRALEIQLRQAQKMEAIGRLAGGVAHDFNNLLTAIFSFTRFAMDALPEDSAPRQDMAEVFKAAQRAQGLTGQLLAFSRQKAVAPRILNVNESIGEMRRMLERVVGEDVSVHTELEAGLWNTRIDAGSLEQVLMNLAVNARDAMPRGGNLTVITSNIEVDDETLVACSENVPSGEYVLICVADEGEGMDQETLDNIFEPFFTTKAAGKGTGLGLSTCYGIVKQAGGYVGVVSARGEGSVFALYLPRTHDALAFQSAVEPPSRLRGHETILVVEDEAQLRRLTARILTTLGYRVIQASDGEDAFSRCLTGGFMIDLLLTDVVMPKMSGKDLAVRLSRIDPKLKVLYMSGYTADVVATRGVLDEGTALLEKPFTPEALAEKVRAVLDA